MCGCLGGFLGLCWGCGDGGVALWDVGSCLFVWYFMVCERGGDVEVCLAGWRIHSLIWCLWEIGLDGGVDGWV